MHTHAKDSVIVMFVSPRKCPGVDTRLTINRDAFAGLNQEVINRYRLRGVSVALFLYAEWLLFLPLHQHDTMGAESTFASAFDFELLKAAVASIRVMCMRNNFQQRIK